MPPIDLQATGDGAGFNRVELDAENARQEIPALFLEFRGCVPRGSLVKLPSPGFGGGSSELCHAT